MSIYTTLIKIPSRSLFTRASGLYEVRLYKNYLLHQIRSSTIISGDLQVIKNLQRATSRTSLVSTQQLYRQRTFIDILLLKRCHRLQGESRLVLRIAYTTLWGYFPLIYYSYTAREKEHFFNFKRRLLKIVITSLSLCR